jgi:phosphoglycolate phosphatase-like HAD superfamily hydrolase
LDLLTDLKTKYGSSQMFVLTNRRQESVTQIAAALGLDRYFAFIQSVAADGTENPKIAALGKALARFDAPYWSAYVGDHSKDAEAAKQNGSTAILFDPSRDPGNKPTDTIIVDVLTDIIKIVEAYHEPRQ